MVGQDKRRTGQQRVRKERGEQREGAKSERRIDHEWDVTNGRVARGWVIRQVGRKAARKTGPTIIIETNGNYFKFSCERTQIRCIGNDPNKFQIAKRGSHQSSMILIMFWHSSLLAMHFTSSHSFLVSSPPSLSLFFPCIQQATLPVNCCQPLQLVREPSESLVSIRMSLCDEWPKSCHSWVSGKTSPARRLHHVPDRVRC
eukprot:767213-Hanusia_phi.AAC.8